MSVILHKSKDEFNNNDIIRAYSYFISQCVKVCSSVLLSPCTHSQSTHHFVENQLRSRYIDTIYWLTRLCEGQLYKAKVSGMIQVGVMSHGCKGIRRPASS